ncbi:MAG: GGDEF domain-containing protein, partial [Acidiferrobacterales bacterium]
LEQLLMVDEKTGLYNFREFQRRLTEEWSRTERYALPLSLVFFDVDHFKEVNDTHGHKAGDRVLEGVAAILVEHLRMPDKVGRYGGEEFLLVFPETALDQTNSIAEHIRAAVNGTEFDVGNEKITLTISIGATLFVKGEDLDQLLSRADSALYEAKASGRNRVVATKAE